MSEAAEGTKKEVGALASISEEVKEALLAELLKRQKELIENEKTEPRKKRQKQGNRSQ